MPSLRLALFGTFELLLDDLPPDGPMPLKAKALLVRLALPPGRPHARRSLAALLWSADERAARTSLRQCLATLRKAVDHDRLPRVIGDADTLRLDAVACEVDVHRFEALCDDGSVDALEAAVALHRGELLEGFATGADGFDDWLAFERARLAERAHQAGAALLALHARAGRHDRVVSLAQALLAGDPLQESVHRMLMRSYAALGRRTAVQAQFERCRTALVDELGLAPEPATRRLHRDLMSQTPDVTLAADTATGPARSSTAAPASGPSAPAHEDGTGSAPPTPARRRAASIRSLPWLGGAAVLAGLALTAASGLDTGSGTAAGTVPRLDSAARRRGNADGARADALVARGRAFAQTTTRHGLLIGRGYYERALLEAPDHATAHAGLALGYGQEIVFRLGEAATGALALGLAQARRAQALDADSADAPMAEALLMLAAREHAAAGRAARLALSRAPDSADAHAMLAQVSVLDGAPELALAHVAAARALEPVAPARWLHVEAHAHFLAGRYVRAASLLERALLLDAGPHPARVLLAATFGHLGRRDAAAQVASDIRSHDPDFSISTEVEASLHRDPRNLARYREGLARAGLPG